MTPASCRELGLVTGYVEMPGGPAVGRGPAFYLEHAAALFASTRVPLVAFVERSYMDAFRALAPGRRDVTWIPTSWAELPALRHLDRIRANRLAEGATWSPRDVPEYLVVQSAKFRFLQRALELPAFDATHAGWIDIGIAHVTGTDDLRYLDEEIAPGVHDPVRLCQIHRRPVRVLRDRALLYGPGHRGGATFAAGLITARRDRLARFVRACEAELEATIRDGFGHSEEAVIASVYGRHPEWFDWYHGDYYGVLANYRTLRADLPCVVRFFIQEALADGAFEEVRDACRQVHAAQQRGALLEPALVAALHHAWLVSAMETRAWPECAHALLRLENGRLKTHLQPAWRSDVERARALLASGG